MHRTLIAALAAAGCLAAAQAAVASNLAVQGATTLQFTAGPGETNNVTVSRSTTLYTVTDPGSTITPTGPCAAVTANTATCPVIGVSAVNLTLGDLDDHAAIDPSLTPVGVTISGGAGNDTLTGGENTGDTLAGGDGNDTITGGAGDDSLSGDAGADNVQGGAGDDTIVSGFLDGQPDVFGGGAGTDLVDYSGAGDAVNVSLDGVANDGVAGDGDNVGVDVEDITGTAKADTLTGSAAANELDGGDGNDTLTGLAGADGLTGGRGSDTLDAGPGIDALAGGAGADRLRGRDNSRDDVSCGGGVDTAVLDAIDDPRACDIVSRGVAVAGATPRGRSVLIRLTCPAIEGVACTGTLTLRSGTTRVGGRSFAIASGTTATLPVRLTRRGRGARSLGTTTVFRDALGVGVISRRSVTVR